jgi:RHS repeat-associated protein
MKFFVSFLILLPSLIFSQESLLSLAELGSVRYTYNNEYLSQVDRLSPMGEVLYTHAYEYDSNGNLLIEKLIGGLGEIIYKETTIKSPYSLEHFILDNEGVLVEHSIDGDIVNFALDETKIDIEYDVHGRVVKQGEKWFKYDDHDRLVEVSSLNTTIKYGYGPLGERIFRTIQDQVENYLYLGINEIAILDENSKIKELRIPGLSLNKNILRPIAIETRDAVYAPIHDIQGNIIKLVNILTKEVVTLSIPDAYGRGLSKNSPVAWIFSGKYYDRDAELVYFGARFYSPEIRQWLTPDPAYQSDDPYEYCLGNPKAYVDPDGRWVLTLARFAWGAGVTVSSPVWGSYALVAGGGAALGYAGYKLYEMWQEQKAPPYKGTDLGADPTVCPIEGFKWRGLGQPGSKKGGWYNDQTEESLRPDLEHPGDIAPHWDYKGPGGRARIYIDGSFEWK